MCADQILLTTLNGYFSETRKKASTLPTLILGVVDQTSKSSLSRAKVQVKTSQAVGNGEEQLNKQLPWQNLQFRKATHKIEVIAYVILMYTHWDPGQCNRV